jgi:catechol 2,3-dioxygenase-like lactoylglutathione lyase family enzyme
MPIPLLSVMHVNVNCSDLERSLRFYREIVGLEALTHTNPVPQDGAGFGLSGQVRWDAHLLHDARGMAAPAVDLLEWKEPGPVGQPYPVANHLGLVRLCFAVPELDALHARLTKAGVPCHAAPREVVIDPPSGLAARFFCCSDPDGTCIEFLEQPEAPARMLHLNVNCRDLDRSSDWYQRVLGLERIGHSEPGPVDGVGFGFAGPAEWRADFLAIPGQAATFVIDLLEWRRPQPVGAPYAEANHLGMFRMAFLVEDLHACTESLRAAGVACGDPVWLDTGPEIPIPGLWALFFRDPDGCCLELIQRPELPGG